MSTAYHLVHYRKFSLTTLGGPKLDALCRTALDATDASGLTRWQRIQSRFQALNDAEKREITLNKVADLESAVFGEMCLVQANGVQALLELTANQVKLSDLTTAEVFDLSEKNAPKGTQFIRGMAYWLAVNDNLFFVKTQSMSADMVHDYGYEVGEPKRRKRRWRR